MLDRRSLLRTSGVAAAGALVAAAASPPSFAAAVAPKSLSLPGCHYAADSDPHAGVTRVVLQDHPSPAAGWKAVQARVEIPAHKESGRHSHPGVEIGYVVSGEVLMVYDDRAPLRLRAGDPFFTPNGVVHNARNVGMGEAMIVSSYVVDETKPLVTYLTDDATGEGASARQSAAPCPTG
ncbi:cupin domain-containing protein [Streptomyces laurentii]|uniref:cupin domain-containing protein n=1 Tax=Streptomyces laurentii TaxID=39478 RepID=UPI0033D0F349